MKNFFLKVLFSITSFLYFLSPAFAAPETYKLDPSHTYVSWQISHFGFSEPSGKWMANGTLILDEKAPDKSQVNVSVKVNDVVTGIPKLDEHLRTQDFFDVAKFPTATFVSNKVQVINKKSAKVYGMLTIHGVAKPVVFNVRINKVGVSPINKKKTVGFSASTVIKRSNFGINTYLPGLGNNVKLMIEGEAKLAE